MYVCFCECKSCFFGVLFVIVFAITWRYPDERSVQYYLCEKTLNKKEEETRRISERCAVFIIILLSCFYFLPPPCQFHFAKTALIIFFPSYTFVFFHYYQSTFLHLAKTVFCWKCLCFIISLFPCVSSYRWVHFPRSVPFSLLCIPKSAKEYILRAKHRTNSSTADMSLSGAWPVKCTP